MKRHRVWIEILLLGAGIAIAVALLIASLGAVAGAAAQEAEYGRVEPAARADAAQLVAEHEYDGMVTCSRCFAKHSPALARNASVCVRVCVHDGASFALATPDASYLLNGDLLQFKRVAGERVHLTGTLSGNTIQVSSIMAADQGLQQ